MRNKRHRTTRREFLEIAAAASVTVAGFGFQAAFPELKDRKNYAIFSEGRIGTLKLKNRLIRSATFEASGSNGSITERYFQILRNLTEGGVGMVITGKMAPCKDRGLLSLTQVHANDDRLIGPLSRVADAVHGADSRCKLVAQIGHSGQDEGPTEISLGTAKPRTLTTAEVAEIVEGFAQSIRRIKEAGWDGVELHAAHSYLLAAFISPYSNKRTDKYGGRTANRVRLIREIMDRARALAGPDFPIMIKLNSEETVKGGVTLEMFPEIGEEIEKTGVAAIDVSGSDCLKKEIDRPERETYFYSGAAALDVKVPVIATGGNRSIDHLENVLGENEVQFFGLSRPLIREPHLPFRWLEGRGSAAAECISCNGCFEDLSKGLYHCVQKA